MTLRRRVILFSSVDASPEDDAWQAVRPEAGPKVEHPQRLNPPRVVSGNASSQPSTLDK